MTSSMRSAHAAYFADLVEQVYDTWCGPQQRLAEAAYAAEWDNLRAAHAWAVSMDDPVRADVIVARTSGHSIYRLRHDHMDWGRRSLEIDGAGNRYRANVFGALAAWGFLRVDDVCRPRRRHRCDDGIVGRLEAPAATTDPARRRG
jgi:hypothetical protein